MHTYWSTVRRFNRDIVIYLIFNSAIAFAFMGIMSVLLNLYLLRLGYQTDFIGAMSGSGMVVWGVLALPASGLGSRLGLKRTIVLSMFILSASALGLVAAGSLAEPWRARALIAAWMFLWAGAALVSVNILPYVMAITNDENRSYVFSMQQTLASLMILAGSLISGVLPGLLARLLGMSLDQPLPYQLTMLLTPLFYAIAGLAFLKASDIQPAIHRTSSLTPQPAPLRIFFLLFLIVVLQSSSDGATRTFFNVYLDSGLRVPVAQIGAAMGLAQLLPVLGSLVFPTIMTRIGSRGAMFSTNTLSILFILLIAAIPNGAVAGLAFMGFSGMGAITMSARSIFCQEIVVQRWRTTTSALATIGIALGGAAAAWLGGALISAVGFRGLFMLGAVLALLASLLTILDARLSRGTAREIRVMEAVEE